MSPITTRSRALAVGLLCAAGGIGAGAVATASASSSHSSSSPAAHHAKAGHAAHAKRLTELRRLARHSVQGDVVVRTKQGYRTVSFERGTVRSVSGDQLTITEGTPKSTYKTVTLTVPASAHVRDDGQKSSMSSVSAGQHVLVLQLPKREVVIARTPKHHAARTTSSTS